jgi:hypothetical protein
VRGPGGQDRLNQGYQAMISFYLDGNFHIRLRVAIQQIIHATYYLADIFILISNDLQLNRIGQG